MKFFSTLAFVSSSLLIACSSAVNENESLSLASEQKSEIEVAQLMSSEDRPASDGRERKKLQSDREDKKERNSRSRLTSKNSSLEELAQRFLEKSELMALRKVNVLKALENLNAVKALPNKGLIEANAKCEKIGQALEHLKVTKSPKRPFDGLRTHLRKELSAQRIDLLKDNGVESCGAVKNLLASLPPSAPVVPTSADAPVEHTDADDSEEASSEDAAATATVAQKTE